MSGYSTLDPDPRTQTNEELAKRLERWANARDKRARHTREHQRGPGPTGTEILRVAAERLRQLDPTEIEETMSIDTHPSTSSQAALALRDLQLFDELEICNNRYLILRAQNRLGEILGLECTGIVDGTNADGSPAFYSHNGDTCPIHEWLVPSDAPDWMDSQS